MQKVIKFLLSIIIASYVVNATATSLVASSIDKSRLYSSIKSAYAMDGIKLSDDLDGNAVVSTSQFIFRGDNKIVNLSLNVEHTYNKSGGAITSCSIMLLDKNYTYLSKIKILLPIDLNESEEEDTDCRNFESIALLSSVSPTPSFVAIISYGPSQFGSPDLHPSEPRKYFAVLLNLKQMSNNNAYLVQNFTCLKKDNNINTIALAKSKLTQCGER